MSPDASNEHRARSVQSVACAVVTISDTRTPETDTSGALIRDRLQSAGHRVLHSEISADDPDAVRRRVLSWCSDPQCQAILLTGGTGIALRDTTIEAIADLLEKRLDGFGELFRLLSYEEIGAAAMLSRATAGVREATVIFAMPGSTAAVRLAMDKLILPELGHVAALIRD